MTFLRCVVLAATLITLPASAALGARPPVTFGPAYDAAIGPVLSDHRGWLAYAPVAGVMRVRSGGHDSYRDVPVPDGCSVLSVGAGALLADCSKRFPSASSDFRVAAPDATALSAIPGQCCRDSYTDIGSVWVGGSSGNPDHDGGTRSVHLNWRTGQRYEGSAGARDLDDPQLGPLPLPPRPVYRFMFGPAEGANYRKQDLYVQLPDGPRRRISKCVPECLDVASIDPWITWIERGRLRVFDVRNDFRRVRLGSASPVALIVTAQHLIAVTRSSLGTNEIRRVNRPGPAERLRRTRR